MTLITVWQKTGDLATLHSTLKFKGTYQGATEALERHFKIQLDYSGQSGATPKQLLKDKDGVVLMGFLYERVTKRKAYRVREIK